MSECIVIFGAAVREDGSPSGSLRRRCEAAAAYGCEAPSRPWFLPTGGVGRHGPAEALVMRDLLVALGVEPSRILLEPEAADTLQSVRLCTRLLRARGDVVRVLVATSSYHRARCTLLFRLAGFDSQALSTPSDRAHLGTAKWLGYVLKECLATPWDALLLLVLRIGRMI